MSVATVDILYIGISAPPICRYYRDISEQPMYREMSAVARSARVVLLPLTAVGISLEASLEAKKISVLALVHFKIMPKDRSVE